MSQIRQRQRPLPPSDPAPNDNPVPAQVRGVEGSILVSRARYEGNRVLSEIEHEEKIVVPMFDTEVAEVEVEGSVTRNLGNYNSARVAVRVKLPAYPVLPEMDRAYMLASTLVDRYVTRELDLAINPEADPSAPLPEV